MNRFAAALLGTGVRHSQTAPEQKGEPPLHAEGCGQHPHHLPSAQGAQDENRGSPQVHPGLPQEVDRDAEITEHLMNIRAILLEIKQDLAYGGAVVDDDCDEEPVAVPQQSGTGNRRKGGRSGRNGHRDENRNGRSGRPCSRICRAADRGDPGESGETGPCHGGYQSRPSRNRYFSRWPFRWN